ncbi:carbohydrate ABC transporter permease [Aquibacillus albus]|uniref:Raffinose/stachyose/melibiose transport system permease protein n=1 Tax=Aquibacillus albus TaxID=1168171 RepID=A0ABS2N4H0_9BACI|nr:sugar ABC transporter permease [Aquibacillus albus]MBM7573001.1 raffinose/stachyose/melibiose transport system permease protein [Aquibacillus albus]
MKSSALRPKWYVIWGLLLPTILLYGFVVIIPLFNSIRYSFYKWMGGPLNNFVGLDNYSRLIHDDEFWGSFQHTMLFVVLCILGQIGIGFLLAIFVNSKLAKFQSFHRISIFFPVVVSAVVIGFIWSIIYNKDVGILNWVLQSFNLDNLIVPWLDDPKYVMYSVTAPIIWQYIGLYMIIFLASLQSIPQSLFEAAEIDGASGWKKTIHITIPMLNGTFLVALMLCIAGNMKAFDHIFVMTGGGPGNSSMLMSLYAYTMSFDRMQMGYGSAISIGMLVISLTIIGLSRKLLGGNQS